MKILFLGIGNAPERLQMVSFFPENYLERNFYGHEIITFGYNEGVDIKIRPEDDFRKVIDALPEGWTPDLCLLWGIEWNLLPLGIENVPFPVVAYTGDWDYDIPLTKATVEAVDLTITIGDFERESVKAIGANNAETFFPQGLMSEYFCAKPKKIKDRKYDVLYSTFIDDVSHPDRSGWIVRLCSLSGKYNVLVTAPGRKYGDYVKLLQDSKLVFSTHRYGSTPNRILEAGAQGAAVLETGEEVRKHFMPDEEYIPVAVEDFTRQIERYLSDDGRLQKMSDNVYRKISGDFEARKRFAEFIEFIGLKLKSTLNVRASKPLSAFDGFIRRGESLYYSFFSAHLTERREGLLELCIREFKKAAALDPSPRALTDLSVALMSCGFLFEKEELLEEARSLLRSTVSEYPLYVMGHFNLGLAYFRRGDLQEALNIFDNVLGLLKDKGSHMDPWCLHNRDYDLFNKMLRKPLNAALLSLCKDEEAAAEEIRGLYRAVVLYFISVVEERRGDIHGAANALLESYELLPENGKVAADVAGKLALLGYREECLAAYRKAVELLPLDIDLRVEFIQLLYLYGRDKEVVGEINKVLKITRTVNQLKEKTSKLKDLIERCSRLDRDSPYSHDSLKETVLAGWAETLFSYLRKKPDDMNTVLRIVEIWSELGRADKIVEIMEDLCSARSRLNISAEESRALSEVYNYLRKDCEDKGKDYEQRLSRLETLFTDLQRKSGVAI